MKKTILLILFLLFAVCPFVFASGGMQPVGAVTVVTAGGGTVDNCPDATYDFAWTGDNTSGTTTLCVDNGTSTSAASVNSGVDYSTDYGVTGYGLMLNNTADSLAWTINVSPLVGTIWYTIYTETPLTSRGQVVTMDDGTDMLAADLDVGSASGRGYYGAQNTADSTTTAPPATVRCAYTWDNTGTDKHAFLWDSTNWADSEEDVEELTAPAGNWTELAIGDDSRPVLHTGLNRATYVDDVYVIIGTYKAADPKP